MTDRTSDMDLVRRARQGDPAAWRQLVRRHTPMVYRLALRTLRHPADAEDATQEVFVRMSKSLDSYDPTRPLPPWLGKVTYHVCLRRLEGLARRNQEATEPSAMDGAAPYELAAPSPESALAASEAHALLSRAIAELPAQDRFLIDLRYREGHSDVEVAEATGMNVNTVRTRLFRARQVLKRLLSPLFSSPEEDPT